MCGIAGALSSGAPIDPAVLTAMGDAISHRGPDGEGYLLYAPESGVEVLHNEKPGERRGVAAGFSHRRLSIIDLSEASDQPMLDTSGELAIAYNGELYNYVELRDELAALGRPSRTEGDTEVVLNAYAEWGPDCLQRMVGMWALAILDLRRRHLFLAVDRFAIKPLFYAVSGDRLHFASEIKSLLEVQGLAPEPNEDAVRRFLLSGRVDESEETFFEGIHRLQGAHHLTIPLDGAPAPQPRRYWEIPGRTRRRGRRAAAREFAELLSDSIRIHLRSDVPVGTCLSGGLDSSAIVCLADELRRRGEVPHYAHNGFGYLPQDPAVSERRHMEEVVRKTGIEMEFVEPSPDEFASALLEIVRQQDEPFGSTSIAAQWFVFRRAHRAGLKVMLDGQGADEVLGGYHGYLPLVEQVKTRPGRLRRMFRHAPAAPDPSAPLPEMPVMSVMSAQMRERCRLDDVASPEFHSINEILAAHTASIGLPSLLRFEDRNSMAHSIEARVPFLDHRLVEFAFSLPGEYKIDGVETKAVLRSALRGVLPEAIRTRRDKIGFRAEPTATWALAERHRSALVENRTEHEKRWFDSAGLESLFGDTERSQENEFMLWRVINTKLWLRDRWGGDADPLA